MAKRITDAQLRARIRQAIRDSTPRTELGFRLTAEGIACGRQRLIRVWAEEGGPVQPKHRVYAYGTGPMDPWYARG